MTPSGAFGLNVGIQDAHNLAWKLALAIHGRFATEQSYLQFSGAHAPRPFGNWGVILGASYTSDAVIPDGTAPPETDDPATDYVPVARPGHRAPHAWLGSGETLSTVDVVGDSLVVVSLDARWTEATLEVERRIGIPLRPRILSGDVAPADPAAFEELFGIGERGAILVRPDGYVGWRTLMKPGVDDLEAAVRRILHQ
jgi:hypothetical protein